MEGRKLLQYIIDTSDVVLAKKQEAAEYLDKLEEAAQRSVQADGACLHTKFFESGGVFTCADCYADITPRRKRKAR